MHDLVELVETELNSSLPHSQQMKALLISCSLSGQNNALISVIHLSPNPQSIKAAASEEFSLRKALTNWL